ncbi:MAG: CoA transferase, partial [Acidimicrobiales bacterium]
RELQAIFVARPSAEWVALGARVDTPIVTVNTPRTLADDPQFRARMPWIPEARVGADQLPTPIRFLDRDLPVPQKAPTIGQHTDDVLRDVLGYDDDRIAALRAAGTLG